MAFGVENGGGSGIPAGRPLPCLKHALPARQENVQSLHAFLELCVQYFVHRQAIDKSDLHTGCYARDEFGSNGVCRTRRGNSD